MEARPKLNNDLFDKDKKGQRGEEDCQKDKIKQVVRRDSNFEVTVYYHIIKRY